MYMKATSFMEVVSGYTFRGAIKTEANGDVFILQAKDIVRKENITNSTELNRIVFQGTRTASFLQKGDVVIVSRATGAGSFRSVVFDSEKVNVVGTSSLLILRIKNKEVLPEYLSLYLNSPDGQKKILDTVVGSYIYAISKNKFEEIEIPIPPLDKQKSVVDLQNNIVQQEIILERKQKLNREIINATLRNLATQKN